MNTNEAESFSPALSAGQYVPSKRVWMKSNPTLTEKWLQQQIQKEPGILGLGEVEIKDVERVQPRAGRLDLLLYDAEATTRYELELQLGATDESHIIRTIEYWDVERKRYPQYDHVAVIVAEEITARFFNVISLFNGYIPIVAIQVSAMEVAGNLTLIFTKVLDTQLLAVEEDDQTVEPRDRNYWQTKSSPAVLATVDRLLALIQEVEPKAQLNYNKYYIGLTIDGVASNFLIMEPKKKQAVVFAVRTDRDDALTQQIEEAGIELLQYQVKGKQYRIRLSDTDLDEHRELLRELIESAHDSFSK